MRKIKKIIIRHILNSMGGDAFEAEIELEGGSKGVASAPVAIEPGKREKQTTGSKVSFVPVKNMENCFFDQNTLDTYLEKNMDQLGADITLSISLAFARANSQEEKTSLVEYLENLLNVKKINRYVIPLVPIFSGGIHDLSLGGSMQQIMISVKELEFEKAVHVIRSIYHEIEFFLKQNGFLKGLAASSGFLTRSLSIDEEFLILKRIIQKSKWKNHLSIAIDVAAEHLWENGKYRFYNKLYTPKEFENLLFDYANKYSITFIEDPFCYVDVENWRALYTRLRNKSELLADDYSATQIQYFDETIADGFIIKMKQVGTLTATLKLISKIKDMNLKICVSHRSCETEDTFICDLAMAFDSDYIKIGAPCRGDRVEKYNRLIRLYGINVDLNRG